MLLSCGILYTGSYCAKWHKNSINNNQFGYFIKSNQCSQGVNTHKINTQWVQFTFWYSFLFLFTITNITQGWQNCSFGLWPHVNSCRYQKTYCLHFLVNYVNLFYLMKHWINSLNASALSFSISQLLLHISLFLYKYLTILKLKQRN